MPKSNATTIRARPIIAVIRVVVDMIVENARLEKRDGSNCAKNVKDDAFPRAHSMQLP